MSAGTYNLMIDQGSDFALDLVIKQSGTAMDLSNYSGRAQLRTSVDASSVSATFTVTKTNASGGALKMTRGRRSARGAQRTLFLTTAGLETACPSSFSRGCTTLQGRRPCSRYVDVIFF